MADLEQSFWRRFGDQGLQVIAVNRGQSAEEIRSFAARVGITFPLLVDTTASIYQIYRGERAPSVAPFPRDVLLDADGRILYYSRVYEPRVLTQKIEELLSASRVERTTSDRSPRDFALWANPNPFRKGVRLTYELGTSSQVRLRVFDVRGRVVAELEHGRKPRGVHTVWWDGRSSRGMSLPAGLYLCVLEAGTRVVTAKLILLP